MSGAKDALGLADRSVFDRVVTHISGWIEDGSVEFRFLRGGAFRATVVRERLEDALKTIRADKDQFDRALVEVVTFLNGIIFDQTEDAILRALLTPRGAGEAFSDEVRRRFDFVKNHVTFEGLRSRAKMRAHAVAPTLDSSTWSIMRGRLIDEDDQSVMSSGTLGSICLCSGQELGLRFPTYSLYWNLGSRKRTRFFCSG